MKNSYIDYKGARDCQQINLKDFYNLDTLNIFCDASMRSDLGCYGAIAVHMDNIIDSHYFFSHPSTNNESEAKGIREALIMANNYKGVFKNINIFSDSLCNMNGVRKYIYNWKCKDNKFYTQANTLAANQGLLLEAHYLYMILLQTNPNCKLYHQRGHINTAKNSDIYSAADDFKKYNDIYGMVDLNLIRYISTYNNYVDRTSRSRLNNYANGMENILPITFYPLGPL